MLARAIVSLKPVIPYGRETENWGSFLFISRKLHFVLKCHQNWEENSADFSLLSSYTFQHYTFFQSVIYGIRG